MTRRTEFLARLCTQHFDVLVIGGGIVGAAIVRDAAMRGLRVALIDKGDFAGGTSSKTSKLIHGGLRYLEQGRVRLVRESLHERAILHTLAPALVWPLPLLLPVYHAGPRPSWQIALGLTLYDALAGANALQHHRLLSIPQAIRTEPRLNPVGLRAAALYTDCQMDDARLCVAHILQAVGFGAVCCNYVKLLAFEKARHQICGARVEDMLTGEQFDVRAHVVINAGGPWSDAIRRLSAAHPGVRLAPTKGIHLVVPRLSDHGLAVQSPHDRRLMFVLPWKTFSLIGTTESSDFGSLETLSATHHEVAYLLDSVNRIFPDASLRATDVITTFAGARPLLAFAGSSHRASREHRLEVDRFGLISIMGGKYTTARLMAKQTVDLAVARLGARAERCLTDQIALLESVDDAVLSRWQEVMRGLEPALVARLLATYGAGSLRIFRLLEFEPQLSQPLCPHHDTIGAEFVYGLQDELACTVSDLLMRRTAMAYSPCHGLDALETIVDLCRRYGGLSHAQLEEHATHYRATVAHNAAFREPPSITPPADREGVPQGARAASP